MKRFISAAFLFFLLFSAANLFAQDQKAVLVFFEDSSGDFKIVNADATEELYGDELEFGAEVPVGWTVVTGNGDMAELQLQPNRTIIKVAENTNFRIEGLQGLGGAKKSSFALGFGKIRCVVGRITGDEEYAFAGKAATCGVRGTDFVQQIIQDIGGKLIEEVLVLTGEVEYFLNSDPAKTILVKAGQYADAMADTLQALTAPQEKINSLLEELGFLQLEESEVPDKEAPKETAKTTSEETPKAPEEPAEEEEKPEDTEGFLERLLGEVVGFEVGAITIGDQTYAKAVVAPTFGIGKLKMSLYLPIIYSENILDPNDWYKPKGNSEWSFGFDYWGDWWAFTKDFAYDLFLKIKYIQWGDIRDPFFFKVGNLSNFTVGHGLIMRNYANDYEFPAIRRIGVNFGLDLNKFGFETLVNDLTDPLVFGGRFYFRPFAPTFKLAFGLSSIVDIGPAVIPNPAGIDLGEMGRPIFINAGLDIDLPIVEQDRSNVILFADAAGLMPYFTNAGYGAYPNIEKGLAWETLINTTSGFSLKNIGAAAGGFGNFGPLDWRLEYRYYTGSFRPAIFDGQYDRYRIDYVKQAAAYANDLTSSDEINMGIYGEAGYTFGKIFTLSVGYEWPLELSGGKIVSAEDDSVFLKAILERGVIPFVDVGAQVSYERSYLIPWLLDGITSTGYDLSFLDAYSAVKTEVVYGVSENLDVIFLISTSLKRNPDGTIYFDPATYLPEVVNTFSFETQIHF